MRRPTGLEWVAWALHAGARAIDEEARRNGLPFRAPNELTALAEAFVQLAQSDVATGVATLPDDATQADSGLRLVGSVAEHLGVSRRTIERRMASRGIGPVKRSGRSYIREADIEKLK